MNKQLTYLFIVPLPWLPPVHWKDSRTHSFLHLPFTPSSLWPFFLPVVNCHDPSPPWVHRPQRSTHYSTNQNHHVPLGRLRSREVVIRFVCVCVCCVCEDRALNFFDGFRSTLPPCYRPGRRRSVTTPLRWLVVVTYRGFRGVLRGAPCLNILSMCFPLGPFTLSRIGST